MKGSSEIIYFCKTLSKPSDMSRATRRVSLKTLKEDYQVSVRKTIAGGWLITGLLLTGSAWTTNGAVWAIPQTCLSAVQKRSRPATAALSLMNESSRSGKHKASSRHSCKTETGASPIIIISQKRHVTNISRGHQDSPRLSVVESNAIVAAVE